VTHLHIFYRFLVFPLADVTLNNIYLIDPVLDLGMGAVVP
jgi:hypothetical protein